MTVIFVLEGDMIMEMVGMYRSQSGDYLTLRENGTYHSTFGTKGTWRIDCETIILIPDNGWLPTTCSIREGGEIIVVGGKAFRKY